MLHQFRITFRLFQKYQYNEFLAVHSAIGFWKELLKRELNSSILQQRGMEISRCYIKIQEIVSQLQQIYPDDIKFLCRYGKFLVNIINNEFEGISNFYRAHAVYDSKMQKKTGQQQNNSNESQTFGENSGASIFIVSATFTKYGQIVHVNEEVETLLGFKSRELIGKNISFIMPAIIGIEHNGFIERYFESGKQHILGSQRQLFAVNNIGYLQLVELIIKVHPDVAGRVLFIGMVQKLQHFELMEMPKLDFYGQDQHYIIADSQGYISNVTDGLTLEMGLHPGFFNYSKENLHSLINIQQLCSCIMDQDVQISIENDGGMNLTFDTTNILDFVELEKLSSEEIIVIKASLGIYKAFVQQHRFTFGNLQFLLYRIIMADDMKGNDQSRLESRQDLEKSGFGTLHIGDTPTDLCSIGSHESGGGFVSASVSSTSSNTQSFNNVIKNFKQSLSEKQVPASLVLLNRLIFGFLLIMIILQSTDFAILKNGIYMLRRENWHNLKSELRTLSIVQIVSNVRSMINLGNGLEFDLFELDQLNRYEGRFEYLGRLVADQEQMLQEIQEFMTQQRLDGEDAGTDRIQSIFEFENITLFRLDDSNRISTYNLPYRLAFLSYLNQISDLNQTTKEDLALPKELLDFELLDNFNEVFPKTTLLQKSVFSLYANGLRSLRQRSLEATIFQQKTSFNNVQNSPNLIIMILGIILTVIAIIVIIYQIWQIERIQGHILSVYAHLSLANINEVYARCCIYMEELRVGSFMALAHENENPLPTSTGKPSSKVMTVNQALTDINTKKNRSRQRYGSYQSQISNDIVSEEEKEQFQFKQRISAINILKSSQELKKKSSLQKKEPHTDAIADIFTHMIKNTLLEIKTINDKEKNARDMAKKLSSTQNVVDYNYQKPESKNSNEQEEDKSPKRIKSIQKKIEIKSHKKKKKKVFFPSEKQEQPSLDQLNEGESHDDISSDVEETKHSNELEIQRKGSQKQEGKFKTNNSKRKHLRKGKKKSSMKLDESDKQVLQDEVFSDNIDQRKKQFSKTLKTQHLGRKIMSFVIGLIVCAYFVQAHILDSNYQSQLGFLQKAIPLFLNRYRYLILAYSLLRERIIYNNSLASFETEPGYGHNLDQYYYELSINNEQQLLNLKQNTPAILKELIGMLNVQDSPQFCPEVIAKTNSEGRAAIEQTTVDTNFKASDFKQYQGQIVTVIAACRAAYAGDVSALANLRSKNVDINQGDYDSRTPLHWAVRGNQTEAVRYLVNAGVKVNPIDRWGATPLNYVRSNLIEMKDILLKRGALLGIQPQKFRPKRTLNMTDNEFRLQYAALNNDIRTAELLIQLGANVNAKDIDRRTAIHVAAGQGHIPMIQFLVFKGGDLTALDSRGHNPMDEAEGNGFIECHNFIDSILSDTIIKNNCLSFHDGLLKQGLQPAIGNFHKKFSDLLNQIKLQRSYDKRLEILLGFPSIDLIPASVQNFTFNPLQTFQQIQELFLSRILNIVIIKITDSFTAFCDNYSESTMIIFIMFILFQACTLFILRNRMMAQMQADIFESRGILNLIPNHIIEQNKNIVEKIITKLKD